MATTAPAAAHMALASFTWEVADVEIARRFSTASGVDTYSSLRPSEAHSTGSRASTLGLTAP